MNLVTRKQLAGMVGVSITTFTARYAAMLESARSKALDKPVSYFPKQAYAILVREGALAWDEQEPDAPTGLSGKPRASSPPS